MRSPFVCATSAIVLGVAGSASASILSDYNLIVLGNMAATSDVEGRAFIGGNLSGGGTFASALNAGAYAGIDTLRVGGSVTVSSISLQAGNLRRSGSRSGTINFNGGGVDITDPAVLAQVPSVSSELFATSAVLAGLATDSIVTFPSGQPAPVTFNAAPGGDGIAVFNVAASSIFNNLVQQMNLNINGATSIVINVSGGSANWTQGAQVGSFLSAFSRANVIWNFYQASTLSFSSNMNGAVLAPGATLTNFTSIDGSTFVGALNANGEIHLPGYTGTVPAPGALGLLGLAGIAAGRRRR